MQDIGRRRQISRRRSLKEKITSFIGSVNGTHLLPIYLSITTYNNSFYSSYFFTDSISSDIILITFLSMLFRPTKIYQPTSTIQIHHERSKIPRSNADSCESLEYSNCSTLHSDSWMYPTGCRNSGCCCCCCCWCCRWLHVDGVWESKGVCVEMVLWLNAAVHMAIWPIA